MKTAAPRKRRRWVWLLGLSVLVVVGWFALRAFLQPERLSAFLLQKAEAATGLTLALDRPADVGLWPDLHLVLHGLTARAPNDDTPILKGHRIEIVLPWSALRGDTLRLRELRLTPVTLDIDALLRWLDTRAEMGPPAPLHLPQLDAGIVVSRSRITYGDWALADVNLDLPGLRNGEPSTARISAILSGPDFSFPFSLVLLFDAQQTGNEIRLDPLVVMARDTPQSDPWFELKGRVALTHPQSLRFNFEASLPQWRAEWPTLPLPDASDGSGVTLKLDYAGTPQLQGRLELHLSRGDESIAATLELDDILAWIDEPQAHPLPPLRGTATAARLQFDSIELRGVSVRIDDNAPAAKTDSDAKP